MEKAMKKGKALISDHDHPMHKGPHHEIYVHVDNRGGHELGNKSHLSGLMGKPKGADVSGHYGKM